MKFMGSFSNGVEVTVYPQPGDLVVPRTTGPKTYSGRATQDSGRPSVVSCSTTKSLGEAAGAFTLVLKDPVNGVEDLVDDDWIDITYIKNGKRYHKMRGLIDTFDVDETSSGGATVRTITITGRDFGSIFDRTKIWFNTFRAENVGNNKTVTIAKALDLFGDPSDCVQRILFGFLETLAANTPPRANWVLPPSMPGGGGLDFPTALFYDPSGFSGEPERQCVSQQLMDPAGKGVWALMKEWSDPAFCEVFCDLVSKDAANRALTGVTFNPDAETDPTGTLMGVIFRDRPFPTVRDGGAAWRRLPTTTVLSQDCRGSRTARSGAERFNAFFVSPSAIQQMGALGLDVSGPLWNPASMLVHGFKDFSVDSRYVASNSSAYTMSIAQRETAMNFHALNAYLRAGEVRIGPWHPEIRVGTRLRVDPGNPALVATYYIEEVSDSWRLGESSTMLGVTRGWIGPDETYQGALIAEAARYVALTGHDAPPEPLAVAEEGG